MLQSLKYALADLIEWDILFFDEPFSSLDLKRRKIAQDYINQWTSKSKTMIFATHDPEWGLSYCSRILLLDDCKIKIDQNKMRHAIKETSFENLKKLEISEGFKVNPSKKPFFRIISFLFYP